jgi:hypothetical protein
MTFYSPACTNLVAGFAANGHSVKQPKSIGAAESMALRLI